MAAKFSPRRPELRAAGKAGPKTSFLKKDFKMLMFRMKAPHRARRGRARTRNFGEFLAPNGAWQMMASLILRAGRKFPVVSFAHRSAARY